MSLFIVSFMLILNWQYEKGALIVRPSDNAIFYKYRGNHYYVPYPTTCRNLKISGAKISTGLTIDTLSIPSIYDMEEADTHCIRTHVPTKLGETHECPDGKCSAVATIYNMVPGGGEKYLFCLWCEFYKRWGITSIF